MLSPGQQVKQFFILFHPGKKHVRTVKDGRSFSKEYSDSKPPVLMFIEIVTIYH